MEEVLDEPRTSVTRWPIWVAPIEDERESGEPEHPSGERERRGPYAHLA